MGSVVGMYAQIWPLVLTIAMVAGYFLKQFFWPAPATRKHEQLRLDWLQSLTTTAQTEVLGVQTIRNSLMSCTMTATTATLAFMGGVTLLHGDGLAQVERQHILYWHALAVLLLLGLAFITSMLAARQWHHAGLVVGMPVASPQRQQWLAVGQTSLRRAGRYYAASVRLMMWCVPMLLVGLFPVVGLVSAGLLLVLLLLGIDR